MKGRLFSVTEHLSLDNAKIIDMVIDIGYEGYGVFMAILGMLSKNNGRMELNENKISFFLRAEKNVVERVIKNYGLFQFDGSLFFSPELLSQIKSQKNISEKMMKNANKRWGSDEQDCGTVQGSVQNDEILSENLCKSNAIASENLCKSNAIALQKHTENDKNPPKNEENALFGKSQIETPEKSDTEKSKKSLEDTNEIQIFGVKEKEKVPPIPPYKEKENIRNFYDYNNIAQTQKKSLEKLPTTNEIYDLCVDLTGRNLSEEEINNRFAILKAKFMDEKWQLDVRRTTHLKPEIIKTKIDEFLIMIKAKMRHLESEKQLKNYFVNWIKLQK